MPRYVLHHLHRSSECPKAFAAWRGVDSPLRHAAAFGSCATGGHELWWTVSAADERAALALLPDYLADRTRVVEVTEIPIP